LLSELTFTEMAPSSAVPSTQGPAPVSEMQPAFAGFWVSVPSAARSNTATALLPKDAT
jgi:hypothetical protein